MKGKDFAEWLDKTAMPLNEAAGLFGTSEQTIYKWRSVRGVPPSKSEWVRKVMAEHDSNEIQSLPNRIILEPTREQWREWGKAALGSGMLLDEWAVEALDKAAVEDEAAHSTGLYANLAPIESLRVAEPSGEDYAHRKKDADA